MEIGGASQLGILRINGLSGWIVMPCGRVKFMLWSAISAGSGTRTLSLLPVKADALIFMPERRVRLGAVCCQVTYIYKCLRERSLKSIELGCTINSRLQQVSRQGDDKVAT